VGTDREVGATGANQNTTRKSLPLARVLATTVVAMVVAVLPVFLASALTLTIRAEFGFGSAQLGTAVSVYFAASAVAMVGLGPVVQRVGARMGIRLGAIMVTLSCLTIATVASGWGGLAFGLALAGIGNGLLQPAANLALARGTPGHLQGRFFGAKQAAVPLAAMVAGGAVPIVATAAGWRSAFIAASVLAAGLAILVPPFDGPSAVRRVAKKMKPTGATAVTQRLDLPPLLLLAGASFFGSGVGNSVAAFLVETLVASGWVEAGAGILLLIASLSSVIVRLGVGVQVDRRDDIGLPGIAVLMGVGTIGLIMIAFQPVPWLMIVAALLAFGAGWGWPGLFHLAMVRDNIQAPATASGIGLAGMSIGGVVGPSAFGYIIEHVSYRAAWLVAAAGLVASIMFVMASHHMSQSRRLVR
jgi:MFS family permease